MSPHHDFGPMRPTDPREANRNAWMLMAGLAIGVVIVGAIELGSRLL